MALEKRTLYSAPWARAKAKGKGQVRAGACSKDLKSVGRIQESPRLVPDSQGEL